MVARRRSPRRRTAASLLAAGAVAALGGCEAAERQAPAPADNAAEGPIANLPVQLPAAPLGRAALLAAVREAASAATSGVDDLRAQRELDGRTFEFRIRFGCSGPSMDLPSELLGWSFQPEKGTLRLRAMPTISGEDPVAATVASENIESVEGFWVPRPWLLEPVCPANAALSASPQQPAAPSEDGKATAAADQPAARPAADKPGDQELQPSLRWPKVGIAQFFTATDARTRRRGVRAFESVQTLTASQPLGSQGFDLVLTGRLRALAGGRVIACTGGGADRPPDCIISADIDVVRMERPEDRTILAHWDS